MLLVVDLLGTVVFAVEGATAGIQANLDLLGLMVVAFATALGGGIIRDVLIGAIPPNSIRDWRYPVVAFVGAAVVFCFYQFVSQVSPWAIIIFDGLIGAIPPNSIRDWRYPVVAFVGAAVVFCFYQFVSQVSPWAIIIFDAAGLALFAVAGAAKALDFGIHPFIAVLMGGVTGVGGGTIRDIFLARIPTVLRADVYATAALAGAAA